MKTYQSKLEAGQAAWIMRDNKATTMPIGSVEINVVHDEQGKLCFHTVTYGFRFYDANRKFEGWEKINEVHVFATKEELLASL